MPDVRLSFLPLQEQNFSFKIYRKPYEDIDDKPKHWIRATLGNPGQDCWVVFDPEELFSEYVCPSTENIGLTNKKIWKTLIDKIILELDADEYTVEEGFNRFISVKIASYPGEGNEVINISPYYLKSNSKFGLLLNFDFQSITNQKATKRIQQLSLSLDKAGNSNKNYYNDKLLRIQFFVKKFFPKIFPIKLDNQAINIDFTFEIVESKPLTTRKYIFEKGKVNNSQFVGLKDSGPFQRLEAEPYFVFIFEDAYRHAANDLFKALAGQTYQSTFPGMEKMFGIRFSANDVTKINIKSYSREELDNAILQIEKLKAIHANKKIIGIFIEHTRENSPFYDDATYSPYYYLKYLFTQKQMPVQAVTIEKMSGRDGLKWSVAGIGLQLFAKLGGIPWTVQPSNSHCLILGIGSAHKRAADGSIEKYYAYSVCVDSSGIYKSLDILGEARDEESYILQLSRKIQEILRKQLTGTITKCAIHLPFKIRRKEMKCIIENVQSVQTDLKQIEFQFIKINTKNKFFGFAENNSRVPYESTCIQLSPKEYLVWFEGLLYGKENIQKRIANPVHIEFLSSEAANDSIQRKYLQDIINLSGANWRGFNAKISPISIYYPSIIADYVAEFRQYSNMDLDLTAVDIPWFL